MFVRGCYHKDECAQSDDVAHYVTNDYYCGSGIGGDSPACNSPTFAPATPTLIDCSSAVPAIAPDGKSGTLFDMAAGLTKKNTGVFRKIVPLTKMIIYC